MTARLNVFIKNMANAEEDLYRVWKDLTLNSSVGDQSKYRSVEIKSKKNTGQCK